MICDGCLNRPICKHQEHAKMLDANQLTIDDVFVQKHECKHKRIQTEGRKPTLQPSTPSPYGGKTWDKITYCNGKQCVCNL